MSENIDVASGWIPEATTPRPSRWHRPQLPVDDPFHRPPAGFETLPAGTLLRSREVEIALLGLVPQKVRAWQLLYCTADLNGTPEASVTTVLLPADTDEDGDPAQERPLLAYQCAIDAISSRSFPSYALQRGSTSLGNVAPFELLIIANAVSRGWAVTIADHEGLGGYFGAPREPGYRVLDGIRAATDFAPLRLSPSTPVGVWGYSGGGMASSWVAEMAPEYAPELNIVGAVLGAPVGDPGQTYIRLNDTFFAGLPALVVAGLRHLYPGLGRVIDAHVNDEGRTRLDEIESMSTAWAIARFAGDDFDNYTDIPLADVLASPEVLDLFDDIRLGSRKPECPLLVLQPVHDQIIAVEDVDGQVERYNEFGANVTYIRDRVSEHLSLMILSTPTVLEWLTARFDGAPEPVGSTRTVWSTALSSTSLRGLLGSGRGFLGMGKAALFTAIGGAL
ncbi:lipase family protein [Williamsia soli]|uniref:lipase family protein n=1 Tax=Williamsia soli TaxID=364929 RepID=UPI001A9D6142|nr:lipase family protein [Williamsia soli]